MHRLALGILGSGKGSNCRAILEQIRSGNLFGRLPDCHFRRALMPESLRSRANSEFRRLFFRPENSAQNWSQKEKTELVRLLRSAGVELVVLAGFMRVLKTVMLDAFPRRIINLHPSLLPKFPGREAWKQALAAGETMTGCTVHYVDAGVDSGEIIAQRAVPILPNDTPATLHERIQLAGTRAFPRRDRATGGGDDGVEQLTALGFLVAA